MASKLSRLKVPLLPNPASALHRGICGAALSDCWPGHLPSWSLRSSRCSGSCAAPTEAERQRSSEAHEQARGRPETGHKHPRLGTRPLHRGLASGDEVSSREGSGRRAQTGPVQPVRSPPCCCGGSSCTTRGQDSAGVEGQPY